MSIKAISAGAVLLVGASLGAQSPPPAYIVTRLGVDTVAIERFTRTSGRVEGDLALRYPRVRTFHYVGELTPGGAFKSMTTTMHRANDPAGGVPAIQISTAFRDSVAIINVSRNGRPDTSMTNARFVYHGGAAPTIFTEPPAYGPYEQLLATSRLGKDSVAYALIGPSRDPASAIILRKRGADSVAFTSTFFPGWTEVARVDARGRILGIDSRATTVKTVAQRVSSLNFDDVVKGWAAVELAKGGATGQMSPPDTTRATVGGANISVAYSRPLKRGRVIFGEVVPWNQVWRTGANAATMFTTDKDLVFGTTVVPAGKYTLWTLPTPTGAKLIINGETGQWGTDYHADKDFARLDLATRMISPPVEQFVIGVVPQGDGGLLRYSWDDREYSIPFTVKQP
jgi:hypothetical protein